MGGLLFGAVFLAAAGGENNTDSIPGALSSCKIVSYAAESDSVDLSQITQIEYSDLRELIKAGNFSYLQSQDSQNRQSAPYEKMHETLKEEYNYLKKMADSYKDDGDAEMQTLYENNAKNIRISMAQVQSTINSMNSASQEKTMEDLADTLTASAQNLMNSYNQMAANVTAVEKSMEAALRVRDTRHFSPKSLSYMRSQSRNLSSESPGRRHSLSGFAFPVHLTYSRRSV